MITSKLKETIQLNAKEQEIKSLLKNNPTVLAGPYVPAAISTEYIVFSEFPIGSGKVDFAIFTGRSKMEVVLIEAKGADFTFSNADGSVSAVVHKAADQLRARFSYIKSSYELFRRAANDIRTGVETGRTRYNSVIGPNGYLRCDPDKDILYRGVVIGGRTRDDRLESKLKRDLEENSHPHIKFESWDSWMQKLKVTSRGDR